MSNLRFMDCVAFADNSLHLRRSALTTKPTNTPTSNNSHRKKPDKKELILIVKDMDLMITSYLDVFYAEEILAHLPAVVRRMCEGCLIDSLSQRDHTCIDINAQEQLSLYFDDILAVIDERVILRSGNMPLPLSKICPMSLSPGLSSR